MYYHLTLQKNTALGTFFITLKTNNPVIDTFLNFNYKFHLNQN